MLHVQRVWDVLMGQIGIDYSKLTKEEQMTLLRVFNKSSMLKHRTKAGMRGKHRRSRTQTLHLWDGEHFCAETSYFYR